MSTQLQIAKPQVLPEPDKKVEVARIVEPPKAQAPARDKERSPQKGSKLKIWLCAAAIAVGCVAVYFFWKSLQPPKLPNGFASSNGRIEATEIDVATKLGERIKDELVDEGDYVAAGQELAHMNTQVLEAELSEAKAKLAVSKSAVDTAQSTLAQRESEKAAAEATVAQREADLNRAVQDFKRAEQLVGKRAMSEEDYDGRKAAHFGAKAGLESAKANVAGADAAISTAKAIIIASKANVDSTQATIERIEADIKDSTLRAPRDCRVQYRVAQPGEVLGGGGKVMNLVDLRDVYMTFFLPTDWAGLVKQGAEVRLILDAAPQFVIPAKVTFVADVAQFTPKTVETAEERQKLTFRVKAHIDPELLKKHIRNVKTGLPGMAYVQLDPNANWPANLETKLPAEEHSDDRPSRAIN
jgi:HlyD family secretion protein